MKVPRHADGIIRYKTADRTAGLDELDHGLSSNLDGPLQKPLASRKTGILASKPSHSP